MTATPIRHLLATPPLDQTVFVQGWVRTRRGSKKISFIELNDGSGFASLQVIAVNADFPEEDLKRVQTGAAVGFTGKLVASQGQGQSVELQATELTVYGGAPGDTYPLQKKGHSLEFLREQAHLRFRTNTFGAVFRLRHGLSFAIHHYFHTHGFYYLHTPIITASDAEGAGELFQVTTLPHDAPPRTPEGTVDYAQDFFGSPAFLTVSGQLAVEPAALALSKVYTFGPTFRAENSNTSRHLAEFWMVEPEVAFNDLAANAALAEDFLQSVIRFALDHYRPDLEFLQSRYEEGLLAKLEKVVAEPFARTTYTAAIEILTASGHAFEFPVSWGMDLQSEHERYLVEQHFRQPVIVTDYPKGIKAFYMRRNADGKTVAAMDVLFPGVGEVIGGSQREERLDVLEAALKENDLPEDVYWWYLDTRRFGSAPHSGFGLGLERLLLFVTGLSNVRDVIPYPRTPGHAAF